MNPKSLTKNNIQNFLSLGILSLGLKEEETRRGKALSSSSSNNLKLLDELPSIEEVFETLANALSAFNSL